MLAGGGALLLAGVLAVLVIARGDLIERDGQATTYLVTGRADVPAGLVQDDVVVLSGTATIEGTVEDDVVIISGRARIDGTVHGDVTVLRGGVRLGPEAEVGGDVRASGRIRVAEDATVGGEVGATSVLDGLRELPDLVWFALWLMAGLTVLAAGLAAPGATDRAARGGAARPWRALVLGGSALVVGPGAAAVLAASILGLGVGVLVVATLVLAGAVGTAGAAVALTRQVGFRPGPSSFLAGWAALGAALAVALLISPVLAALAGAVVLAYGVGSLVPARSRPPAATGPGRDSDRDVDPGDGTDDGGPDGSAEPADIADAATDDEPTILARLPIGASSN